MKLLDLTLTTPAENLACDEVLLDACEAGRENELLRFWEPREYFVVVGYGNRVATEVNIAACKAGHVPILRRCSGGGTVLQGPGCLNYSLLLKIELDSPLRSIASTNRFIMERNRAALEGLRPLSSDLRPPTSSAIAIRGHTDLVHNERKFSGNSQRRRKHFLLFHGTFLLKFDLERIETLLPLPSREPEYRRNRAHHDFLTNVDLPVDSVKRALRDAWRATDPLQNLPHEAIRSLARDKYVTTEWNFRF